MNFTNTNEALAAGYVQGILMTNEEADIEAEVEVVSASEFKNRFVRVALSYFAGQKQIDTDAPYLEFEKISVTDYIDINIDDMLIPEEAEKVYDFISSLKFNEDFDGEDYTDYR